MTFQSLGTNNRKSKNLSAAISTTSSILAKSDVQKYPEVAKKQIEMSHEKEDPVSPADTGSGGVTLLMTVVALALSMFLVKIP